MKHLIRKIHSFFNVYTLFFVILLGVLASRSLFTQGYFIMHDDLQMMRQLQLEKCFIDGQIPCRWAPDMGYGFGFPLFNYYPQLPYLIGEIFRIFTIPFTLTVKLTFALSIIASGVSMYLLAKEFFGKLGGLISSAFYIWAPYHAVDVFVRGAMNEAWAFVWFPLILWSSYKLIFNSEYKNISNLKEYQNTSLVQRLAIHGSIKWILVLSFAWFGLFNSHNLMVMIFLPFFALWIFCFVLYFKKWFSIINLFFAGVFALGLSAFFTLPVLFEQNLVQIEKLTGGYYDYPGHFVTLNQLFLSRFWGDGPSTFGVNDGLAFPIGHIHWISAIIVITILGLRLIRIKKIDRVFLVVILALILGIGAAFMTHSKSTFIWKTFPVLSFVQFPWRFLTLNTLGFSLAAGVIPPSLTESKNFFLKIIGFPIKMLLTILLITILLICNWGFFKPVRTGPVTDKEKFSGEAWRLQQGAGIYDYLPETAKTAPVSQRGKLVEVIEGTATTSRETNGTYWMRFISTVESDSALLRINILDFPEWRIFADGRKMDKFIPQEEEWGRIHINLNQGQNEVYAQLYNTWIRTVGNIITFLSWVVFLGIIVYRSKIQRQVQKL